MSAAPRAARDAMARGARGPETESVVMLRGEHHRAGARRARGTRPLPCVEILWCKDRRVFATVAPLAIREGVDAEVDEDRELVTLPGELRMRRPRPRRRERPRRVSEPTRHEPAHAHPEKRPPTRHSAA